MSNVQTPDSSKTGSTNKPHILFIVGSLRKGSLNRQVANAAIEIIGDRATCEILEWGGVPVYNQDIENPAPKAVVRVHESVAKADALWLATPEYNHGVPGALKNLIDWLTRPVSKDEPALLTDKPTTVSTTAGKSCGRYVQAALLPILEYLEMPQPKVPFTSKCYTRPEVTSDTLAITDAMKADLSEQVDALLAELQGKDTPSNQTDVLPEGGQWKSMSCWQSCGGRCMNKAYVVDGKVVRQKTDDTHPDSQDFPQQRSCPRGKTLASTWLGEDRIKHPMKRKHWQPGGKDFHPELRGCDEWERITWDEAIDYISSEVKRVFEQHGSKSFFGVSWYGIPYATYLGGSVSIMATGSRGTARFAPRHLGVEHGGCDVKRGDANDRFDLMYNSENVVLYGMNPAWNAMGSPMWHFMKAKENGAKFTVVAPDYNMTACLVEADWIPVRPGTDTAFLLAVAYEMLRLDEESGDVVDWDFIHKYTVGFDSKSMPENSTSAENFLGYVKGEYDGTPKTPQWATRICGTPVEDITRFAKLLSKQNKVMTLNSFGCMRNTATENLEQLMMTVNSMGGHYGKPGHCWGGYYFDSGGDGPCNLILTGDDGSQAAAKKLNIKPKKPLGEPCDDCVSAAQVWDAILNKKYHFTGDLRQDTPTTACEDRDLDIRFMDFGIWSTMRSYPDTTKAVKALREGGIECVVGRGIVPKLDIQYCDIVVPIISDLERAAVLTTGEGYREAIYYYDKVCEPLYESRSNREFESAILEALGEDPRGLYPISEEQALFNTMAGTKVICDDGKTYETLLTITQDDIDAMGVEGKPQKGRITLKQFKEDGGYQVERKKGDNYGYIAYKDFVDDPVANPLQTESGKLEICCQYKSDILNKAALHPQDTWKPYPTYVTPVEGIETTYKDFDKQIKGDYPYLLFNTHFPRFGNGVFGNTKSLAEAFTTPVYMGTKVAKENGIETGDTVLIESRHGSVLRVACVSPTYMDDVIALPNGAWSQFDENGVDVMGGVSTLCGTMMQGMGSTSFNSNNVRVSKYNGQPLKSDADSMITLDAE